MEEVTSWKNHSFTLLIFGGIIVLCSIFFALGMVVGRGQGRHLAEVAFEEQEAKKAASHETTDNFKFNFPSETTGDKKGLSLQPAPDPPPPPRAEPAATTQRPAAKTPVPSKAPPPPAASNPAGTGYLQVFASKNENQAKQELKKVESKGFKATILKAPKDNVTLFKVVVGPYKESELSLAKKDLEAKGYKGAFPLK